MFNKLRSNYFVQFVFSYLKEKKKLKLAKYNKSLKNKLDLDLINYKFFSNRYII